MPDMVVTDVQTAYHSLRGAGFFRGAHIAGACPTNSSFCDPAHGLEQLESLRVQCKRCSHS